MLVRWLGRLCNHGSRSAIICDTLAVGPSVGGHVGGGKMAHWDGWTGVRGTLPGRSRQAASSAYNCTLPCWGAGWCPAAYAIAAHGRH